MIYNLISAKRVVEASVGTIFIPVDHGSSQNLFESLFDSWKQILLRCAISLKIRRITIEFTAHRKCPNVIGRFIEIVNDEERGQHWFSWTWI